MESSIINKGETVGREFAASMWFVLWTYSSDSLKDDSKRLLSDDK